MLTTLEDLARALRQAGFAGVDCDGAAVLARSDGPSAPEFTADLHGGAVRLRLRFALRAPEAGLAAWMRDHPGAVLAIDAGETQLSLTVPAGGDLAAPLAQWRGLTQAAERAVVGWRRGQRPWHGM